MIIPLITPMPIIPTTYYLKFSDLGVIESFTYYILIHIYRLPLALIRGWNKTYNNTDCDRNTHMVSILNWAASCSVILPPFLFSASPLKTNPNKTHLRPTLPHLLSPDPMERSVWLCPSNLARSLVTSHHLPLLLV